MPPLTFAIFNHVSETLGLPKKPLADPEFGDTLSVCDDFEQRFQLPSYSELGKIDPDISMKSKINV